MGLLFRFASQWVAGETMEEGLSRAEEANRRGPRGTRPTCFIFRSEAGRPRGRLNP